MGHKREPRPGPWRETAARLSVEVGADRGRQKALASRVGVSPATMSRFLAGSHQPRADELVRLAAELGTSVGVLLGEPLPAPQERLMVAGDAHVLGIPLVADEIAAGAGALPEVPDERIYWFRESWLNGLGYRTPGRFACIRLGNDARASSMLPTIPPLSVVLVDRGANPERPPARSVWLVEDGDGPVVKRITLVSAGLVIESDNPAPQYHARFIPLTDRPVRDVLRGRAVWWAVEAE